MKILPVTALVVALLALLSSACDSGSEERKPWNAAKAFVQRELKAPSTAKFPTAYDPGVGWETLGAGRWRVWGYVDSQNGFGAMIRTEWRMVVEERNTDWYRLYFHFGDDSVGDSGLWSRVLSKPAATPAEVVDMPAPIESRTIVVSRAILPEANVERYAALRQKVGGDFRVTQKLAVERHPALGVLDSPLNKEFAERYRTLQKDNPDRLKDSVWPMILADECAAWLAN